jgi:predicted transposase/invertase (TIGR01784 family)
MKPGIDPKVDYAFKKVFGTEANVDLLQDLLEAVLGFPLSTVEIINPFNDKDTADDKLSILDVKARDVGGRWFNVEMQTQSHAAIRSRKLYSWSQIYADQLVEGQDFTELRPAYSICFLDARMFSKEPGVYHNTFELVDRATGEVFSNHLGIHILELPKFALEADALVTVKEKWCYFLKHAASLDPEQMPASMVRPPVMKAMEVLMRMSQSAQERDRYENRLKWERDVSQMKKDAYEEGEEKGQVVGGAVRAIHLCQRALKQTLTPREELAQKSLEELQRLAEEWEQRLLSGE